MRENTAEPVFITSIKWSMADIIQRTRSQIGLILAVTYAVTSEWLVRYIIDKSVRIPAPTVERKKWMKTKFVTDEYFKKSFSIPK